MKTVYQLIAAMVLVIVLGTTKTTAQQTALMLHHADGTTTDILFKDKPRIVFGSDILYVRSPTLNLEYDRNDVVRFTFKGADAGVKSLKSETVYRIEADRIVFYGVTSSDHINVYSASGIEIPVRLTTDGSNAVLSLSALPPDACIVTLNGRSFKLVRPKP